jgi:hypothetical protein
VLTSKQRSTFVFNTILISCRQSRCRWPFPRRSREVHLSDVATLLHKLITLELAHMLRAPFELRCLRRRELIFRSRSRPCLPLFNLPTLKFFRLIKFGAHAESEPPALIARRASSPESTRFAFDASMVGRAALATTTLAELCYSGAATTRLRRDKSSPDPDHCRCNVRRRSR